MASNPVKPRRIVRVLDGLWYAGSAPQTLMAPDGSAGGDAGVRRDHSATTGRPDGRSRRTMADGRGQRLSPGRVVPPGGWRLSHHQQSVDARPPGRPGAEPDAPHGGSSRLSPQTVAVAASAERSAPLDRPPCCVPRTAGHPRESELPALRSRFSLVAVDSDPERAQVYAVRRPVGAVGPLLTYIGPLLILLGLLLNDTLGWRVVHIALAPGGSTSLPTAEELRVTLANIGGEQKAPATLHLAGAHADKEILIAENRPAALGQRLAVAARDRPRPGCDRDGQQRPAGRRAGADAGR